MAEKTNIAALIVAAGTGSRAGGAVPKQYAPIGGKPLLRHSIEALAAHLRITAVQVVIHAQHKGYYDEAISSLSPRFYNGVHLTAGSQKDGPRHEAGVTSEGKLLTPVIGGAERSDSVRAGLAALAAHQPDYVLIHDAARPFLSAAIIDALIEKLTPDHAVVPALAVPDTVRRFDGAKWEEVSRDGLLRIQTPQAFPFRKLIEVISAREAGSVYTSRSEPLPPEGGVGGGLNEAPSQHQPPPMPSPSGVGSQALRASPLTTPTDEAAIWLAAGHELAYVAGDEELRKVTTAEDIAWAEKKYAPTRTAVGMGYDVHALVPAGDAGIIRLGGIDIAHGHKLHGHSDADVVLHAIVDALLGTISAGDIGSHFPPSDARWKGANSSIFIEEARAQIAAAGGVIQHLDITIIGEQPKISPHREAMRASIASLLKLPLARVSVKATTTEKLGFEGREEGIACNAIATVTLPEEV